jgi:AhpD family alkylhydroperoxidase
MQRMNIATVVPEGYRAVLGLERYVRSTIDVRLYELIKLRASVLNQCSFCVDMHGTAALGGGEDVRRVVAVAAWREAPFFSDRERAALALTDAVTRLGDDGVPDDVWETAVEELGDELAANVVLAIATINVWNRLSIATRLAPPPLEGPAGSEGPAS